VQHVSDLHPKFALRPLGEERKKERRKKKPQGKNIMSASATQGGHKYQKSENYNTIQKLFM